MEQLVINRVSGLAPYRQLIDHVSSLIRQGNLRAGDKLPAVREMVRTYSLSTNTVQKALQYLKTDGLIVGRPGEGMFIAQQVPGPRVETTPELWVEPSYWSDAERAVLKNRFMAKHPHLRVVEHVGGSDLLWLDDNFMPQHTDSLDDLTEFVPQTYGRSGESARIFDKLRFDGRLFFLPLFMNVQVMACNVDMFARRGLPLPSPEWDWNEFLRLAAALTTRSETWGYMFNCHWDAFIPLVWQSGGALFSPDGRRCSLGEAAAVDAGGFVRSCGPFSALSEPAHRDLKIEMFAKGQVAMMPVGIWGYQLLNEAKCRWVARPLPRGRNQATWFYSRGYALVRRSARREIAKEFMRECAKVQLRPENRLKLTGLPLHRELEQPGDTEQTYRQALSYARARLSDIETGARRKAHFFALDIISPKIKSIVNGPEPVGEIMFKINAEIESVIAASENDL